MTTWSTTGSATTTWAEFGTAFRDTWEDWASVTWGTIESSGLTWNQMAGFMFVTTTGSSTTWTAS